MNVNDLINTIQNSNMTNNCQQTNENTTLKKEESKTDNFYESNYFKSPYSSVPVSENKNNATIEAYNGNKQYIQTSSNISGSINVSNISPKVNNYNAHTFSTPFEQSILIDEQTKQQNNNLGQNLIQNNPTTTNGNDITNNQNTLKNNKPTNGFNLNALSSLLSNGNLSNLLGQNGSNDSNMMSLLSSIMPLLSGQNSNNTQNNGANLQKNGNMLMNLLGGLNGNKKQLPTELIVTEEIEDNFDYNSLLRIDDE